MSEVFWCCDSPSAAFADVLTQLIRQVVVVAAAAAVLSVRGVLSCQLSFGIIQWMMPDGLRHRRLHVGVQTNGLVRYQRS